MPFTSPLRHVPVVVFTASETASVCFLIILMYGQCVMGAVNHPCYKRDSTATHNGSAQIMPRNEIENFWMYNNFILFLRISITYTPVVMLHLSLFRRGR